MATYIEDKDRKAIPRWRDSLTTISIGELDHPINKSSHLRISYNNEFHEKKIKEWKKNKTLFYANELISSSFILGCKEDAINAAEFVLKENSGASDQVKKIALKILGKSLNSDYLSSLQVNLNFDDIYKLIHNLRIQLHNEPRNSLKWTDLARAYEIIGLKEKAKKSIEKALILTPSNRFILRSAARMFIHHENYERAHNILKKQESIKYDPWLLATEIATASIIGNTSRFIKYARKILKSITYDPFHISELASVIATLEFESGNIKKTRKLFKQALKDPSENSLAQFLWAKNKYNLSFEIFEDIFLNVFRPFEAQSYHYFYNEKNWQKSLDATWNWFYDQPFSSRPAVFGSFIASVALQNYSQAIEIAKKGIKANPSEFMLSNNLTYALACNNEIDEAENEFKKINRGSYDITSDVVWLSTYGLLKYRRGYINEGRSYYKQAIGRAKGHSNKRIKAMSAVFFAYEEMISKGKDYLKLKEQAFNFSKGLNYPELSIMLERLK